MKHGFCQFCRTAEATESIEDGETLQEVWLCKSCLKSILQDYISKLNEDKEICCLNTN